jgi:hypothetical protein
MTLAAIAIDVRSSDSAIISMIKPEIIVETNGVLYFVCILPNKDGRLYCLPIANDTLLAAKVVALRAESVDTIPPPRTIKAPYGKKDLAASMIPSSP